MQISQETLQLACFELEVFIEDRVIGVIERYNDEFLFQYDLKAQESDFVSLLMPVRSQAYLSGRKDALHPVFDMNLPEGSLRHALVSRYGKLVRGFNDLALLSLVGQNTLGRLSFGAPHSVTRTRLSLDAMMEVTDADALLSELYAGDAILSGVAGAQPKVLARVSQEDIEKFSEGVTLNDKTRATILSDDVIIKTSAANMPWLAANEYHCLRAAALSGLDVPNIRLLVGGQVLAVDRFDRRHHADGSVLRLGAEDFCSLNGLTSTFKYDGTYERVAKTLREFDDPESLVADRKKFFKSFVVSCVLRNGDAHLKNFTLLYAPSEKDKSVEVCLSPVYDICTTNAYITKDQLALSLAGSKRYPTMKKLVAFGTNVCQLNPQSVQEVMEDVHYGVEAAAKEMTEYGDAYPDFAKTIGTKMLSLWRAGLQSIDRDLTVQAIEGNLDGSFAQAPQLPRHKGG